MESIAFFYLSNYFTKTSIYLIKFWTVKIALKAVNKNSNSHSFISNY